MLDRIFLDYIAARELRLPRCKATGAWLDLAWRGAAEAQVEWVRACGEATLHSYVVYHRQYHPDFPVPYNVAMVELVEGPRLVSTVLTGDLSALRVGMPLAADFEPGGRLVFR